MLERRVRLLATIFHRYNSSETFLLSLFSHQWLLEAPFDMEAFSVAPKMWLFLLVFYLKNQILKPSKLVKKDFKQTEKITLGSLLITVAN